MNNTLQASVNNRLLCAIAEDLKTPLLRVARQAELGKLNGAPDLTSIEASADAALRLLDSYIVSAQLCNGQEMLELEPVPVSAVMYDVAQYLSRLARMHGCSLNLEISRGSGLVMAHNQGLRAALTGLGYSFIQAIGASSSANRKKPLRVIFSAKKTSSGIRAGVYSPTAELGSDMFKQARVLYGTARQPLPEMSHIAGAGIFVADSLFGAMASELKVVKHRNANGLAGLLMPSTQLALL